MTTEFPNQAFIDGQNLYLGTTNSQAPWHVDLKKFRTYLREKYKIGTAYYFIGCVNEENQDLYNDLQKAGFIVVFREHSAGSISHKKGNVDTDVVFSIMKSLYKREKLDKVYLISGDGDYYKLVKFLQTEDRLGKILFPSKKNASALYRNLSPEYYDYLDSKDIKAKIRYAKKLSPSKKGSA